MGEIAGLRETWLEDRPKRNQLLPESTKEVKENGKGNHAAQEEAGSVI